MKKKNRDLMVVVAVIIIVFSIWAGCFVHNVFFLKGGYEKGVVLVTFKENVTLKNATNVAESFNCTIKNYYNDSKNRLHCEVNVPAGEEEKYLELFKEHPLVDTARLNRRAV